ncbi:hypothetical protein GCM10007907_35380 [Chitinimonas prasina]|uniref:Sel1 repeat family protein n=1 Tax=Chitinimonas prasina TaxID=1434937 RepID=A0ABQ5YLA7_9NEIS|nr:tetratricopeptide repeat protein [Chitinimonas prasina]GLR14748.1 hypothetical protein GCM10007907_35380 [Chitinimonas prasina]
MTHLRLALYLLSATTLAAPIDEAYAAYARGDKPVALQRYRQLAEQGHALAQFNYAMMLRRGEAGQTQEDWLVWLEKAAAGGVMNANYVLGLAYERGDGVPVSQVLATRWFKLAAEQGHTEAQLDLGTQYFLGRGAPKDYAEAARWYEKAAEGGNMGAQYLIASMYEHGDGKPVDIAQALMWYTAAARQGDPAAKLKAEVLARSRP